MAIKVSRVMGGFKETLETGVYPDRIHIYSSDHCRTWRRKVKGGIQTGGLKYLGRLVYNYRYDGTDFSIQEVDEAGKTNDWEIVTVTGFTMID